MMPLGHDIAWVLIGAGFLAAGTYVATCRQLLASFSRRLLLESVPESEKSRIEAYLENEDEYATALRNADLLLRLLVVLSLAVGRFEAVGSPPSFGRAALEAGLLAFEVIVLFFVFLEVFPAIVARIRPEERLARRLPLIHAVYRVLSPFRSAYASFVRRASRILGGEAPRPSADILEEEILSVAEEGEREGLLASPEIDMIESIIAFGNVEVSEAMTPRTEMVCLDLDDPLEDNLRTAIECGHSRIPVYRGTKDNITGILYVKDLLRYWPGLGAAAPRGEGARPPANGGAPFRLEDLVRKPHFVPLTKKIGELFQEFKTQRFHIAIILDEFGGTLGLITIEDIIEEIVGEITDEHEKVGRPRLKRLGPNAVEVDGSVRIAELNDQLGIDLPEGEAYDTVGGFLSSHMGKIPGAGEAFEHDSVRFEVTNADARRIRRLRLTWSEKASETERAAEPEPERGKVESSG
jgi:putative hemolysin